MFFRFDVVESSFMLPSNLPFQVIEHKPAILCNAVKPTGLLYR